MTWNPLKWFKRQEAPSDFEPYTPLDAANRRSANRRALEAEVYDLSEGRTVKRISWPYMTQAEFEANFLVGDDGQIFGRDDEQTFNGLVEEFHDYLSTHGHAPGSDVIPGSRSAATAVESAFKTSGQFRRKHGID